MGAPLPPESIKQIHDELDAAVLEAYGWGDLAGTALRSGPANEMRMNDPKESPEDPRLDQTSIPHSHRLPGGWNQGSVSPWDLGSHHPAVSGQVSGDGAGNSTRWRLRSPTSGRADHFFRFGFYLPV